MGEVYRVNDIIVSVGTPVYLLCILVAVQSQQKPGSRLIQPQHVPDLLLYAGAPIRLLAASTDWHI